MRLYRIGDKVVSLERLVDEVSAILSERAGGSTQLEVAVTHGVQRSFVSFLESLGEVRRGPKVALVAFPVANADEVRALAEESAVDFILVLSQSEREGIEGGDPAEVFNRLLETLATLTGYDVVILLASDWRINLVERILGSEVVGISLGQSPLREDVKVDVAELGEVLDAVMSASARRSGAGAGERWRKGAASEVAGDVIRKAAGAARGAAGAARRWNTSKRS